MFLAFDTETTGIHMHANILTAFFIILDDELNEIQTLDLKIKHDEYCVDPIAMEVNKINMRKHLKVAITVEEARNRFENFIKKNCNGTSMVPMGHNVCFDLKMMRSNKILLPEFENVFFLGESLDTLYILRDLKTENKIKKEQSLSLGNITDLYKVVAGTEQLHNAEYDIKLTIELYKFIEKKFF
jgi:DNA polymerase III alpha subunit (gram-positive type)